MGKKVAISMVIMIVLLVLAVGYIGYDKYFDWKIEQEDGIYKQGFQAGYENTVSQLIQQASSCNPVPLFMGNQTINLIAVECPKIRNLLKQAEQAVE